MRMKRILIGTSLIILAAACGKSSGSGSAADSCAASSVTYDSMINFVIQQQNNSTPNACLPRPLNVQADGSLPCVILSAAVSASCDCADPGRHAAAPPFVSAVHDVLAREEDCDASSGPACSAYCVCEIAQATCASLESCRNDVTPTASATGWCYVSSDQDAGQNDLLANCGGTPQQRIRFVGAAAPSAGELTFMACGSEASN